MGIAIDRESVQAAVNAFAAESSSQRAADVLGIARSTLMARLDQARRIGIEVPEPKPKPKPVTLKEAVRLPQSADECWAALDAAIGRAPRKVSPATPLRGRDKRIAIASDFHAPFHDTAAVAHLLAATKGYDQLIINGDFQDFYSISRFTKYEQVSIETELAAVDALMGKFSAHYPDVLIVEGNHDRPRFEKQLRSLLSLELMHVIEYLTGGNLSTTRTIAKRYPSVRFSDVKVGRHHLGWFAQQGDLLVAHAEKFSRVPGSALRGIEEWFADRHDTLGLAPWKVLIQAHTHQLGMFPWHADRLLVECGCLCGTHGYQLSAAIAGRPQRLGFVTLTQRDGVTDLDSVKMHWLDQRIRVA